MNKTLLLVVIKSEIERTTGYTDPGALCLAVARATEELRQMRVTGPHLLCQSE